MKKFRNTPAKSRIIELITASKEALSHAQIQEAMDISIDRVTIYRILERLELEGIVHRTLTWNGTMKFAACKKCDTHHHHDHLHFNCTACDKLICLDQTITTPNLPRSYTVKDQMMLLTGICPACKKMSV